MIACRPMRFAMKFGVSFAGTTPLPNRTQAKSETFCATSGAVRAVRISSINRM